MKRRPRCIGAATISTTSDGQGLRLSQACAAPSLKSRCTQTKSALSAALSTSTRSYSGCPSPLRNANMNSGHSRFARYTMTSHLRWYVAIVDTTWILEDFRFEVDSALFAGQCRDHRTCCFHSRTASTLDYPDHGPAVRHRY